MTWNLWRPRLVCLAMSSFVAWHMVSILIAPIPYGSDALLAVHSLFRPYMTLFRLESSWGFFTQVPKLPMFRYIVESADGKEHTFTPIKDFKWYYPRTNWVERTFMAISVDPEPLRIGSYYLPILCKHHANLKPVSITFTAVTGSEFTRDDFLAGHRPDDPGFTTVQQLMYGECPKD
jgi:hypothetical protein